MDKLRVKEAIIVEGRYDKNTLSQLVEGVILETAGFGIFKDKEKVSLIRRMAESRGIVILTDSDGAGFLIRGHLKGILDPATVKHAYIPDLFGKEQRKEKPGAEGKLGVEGMTPQVLRQALLRAGVTLDDAVAGAAPIDQLTKGDLYVLGLTGTPNATTRRLALQAKLQLPSRMTTNGLLEALNVLYTPQAVAELCRDLGDSP